MGGCSKRTPEPQELGTSLLTQQVKKKIVPRCGGMHALIPTLRRQKSEDICEFKAGLVHIVSSRSVRLTQ